MGQRHPRCLIEMWPTRFHGKAGPRAECAPTECFIFAVASHSAWRRPAVGTRPCFVLRQHFFLSSFRSSTGDARGWPRVGRLSASTQIVYMVHRPALLVAGGSGPLPPPPGGCGCKRPLPAAPQLERAGRLMASRCVGSQRSKMLTPALVSPGCTCPQPSTTRAHVKVGGRWTRRQR